MKPIKIASNALPSTYKKRGKHSPITEEEKKRILELKAQNLTDGEIAKIVGRAQYSVNRIVNKIETQKARKEEFFVWDGCLFL